MGNPSVVTIDPEWEWQKVATSVVTGSINRLVSTVYYYQTFRLTGEAAPINPTIGELPEEAVRMFDQGNQESIAAIEAIDVYILCANSDDDANDIGKLRIDI